MTAIIDHLVTLYPEPGKAYKRTYRASEKKRQLKLAEKEAKKLARQEEARKKKEGKGGSGNSSRIKSKEFVDRSDDEAMGGEDAERSQEQVEEERYNLVSEFEHTKAAGSPIAPSPPPPLDAPYGFSGVLASYASPLANLTIDVISIFGCLEQMAW